MNLLGVLSAVLIIENTVVNEGRLILIPHANESGATHTDPSGGVPSRYYIKQNGEVGGLDLGLD